mmetsp:Transcript_15016/g.40377  ORF Transcript_15016/g.40377 Transcript_15016/m.40377 type:complete len:333 (+) Transcript_15016:33-1031(+)
MAQAMPLTRSTPVSLPIMHHAVPVDHHDVTGAGQPMRGRRRRPLTATPAPCCSRPRLGRPIVQAKEQKALAVLPDAHRVSSSCLRSGARGLALTAQSIAHLRHPLPPGRGLDGAQPSKRWWGAATTMNCPGGVDDESGGFARGTCAPGRPGDASSLLHLELRPRTLGVMGADGEDDAAPMQVHGAAFRCQSRPGRRASGHWGQHGATPERHGQEALPYFEPTVATVDPEHCGTPAWPGHGGVAVPEMPAPSISQAHGRRPQRCVVNQELPQGVLGPQRPAELRIEPLFCCGNFLCPEAEVGFHLGLTGAAGAEQPVVLLRIKFWCSIRGKRR